MFKSVLVLLLLIFSNFSGDASAQESNRDEVRAELSKDFHVIWGKNFTEADWARGTAAIAGSVAAGNPGPFMAWFSNELQETLAKIQQNLPGVGMDVLRSWILQSLRDKTIVVYQGFRVHAGFATYQRWKRVVYGEPQTYKCRWEGPFGSWTWGVCTRTVQKERRISLPNFQQFFVRFQFQNGGNQNQPQPQDSFNRVYVTNKCNQPILVAANYKELNNQWTAKGFWQIQPGQSAYIANTRNTILELNGVSIDGRLHWSGSSKRSINGRSYGFFPVTMTLKHFGRWTQNFVCSAVGSAVSRDAYTGDYEGNVRGQEGGELNPGHPDNGGNDDDWDAPSNGGSGGGGDDWDAPSNGGSGGSGDDWGTPSRGGSAGPQDDWGRDAQDAPDGGWDQVTERDSSGLSDWNSAPETTPVREESAAW